MDPIDALLLELAAPAPSTDELRALALRCDHGDPEAADLARELAVLIDANPYPEESHATPERLRPTVYPAIRLVE